MDRNLRAFLSVAEHRNLKQAAEALGLTQPSMTKRLQNIEEELGGALFDRSRRGMTLTPVGTRFYQRAKRIEQEYLQAREEMQQHTSAGLDVLRVGAGPLFHMRYAPVVFSRLHNEHPDLQFELWGNINERTIPMLLDGQLDVVLGIMDHPAESLGLQAHALTTVEQAVILPENSELLDKTVLSPIDVQGLSWVLYGGDRYNEQWLNHYHSEHGLGALDITLRSSAFYTGMRMVQSGGFAMMAPLQLKPIVDSLGLHIRPVDPPISRRSAGAYVRPSSMGFGAIERFIALLAQECKAAQ